VHNWSRYVVEETALPGGFFVLEIQALWVSGASVVAFRFHTKGPRRPDMSELTKLHKAADNAALEVVVELIRAGALTTLTTEGKQASKIIEVHKQLSSYFGSLTTPSLPPTADII
jgi:hypothetical protein